MPVGVHHDVVEAHAAQREAGLQALPASARVVGAIEDAVGGAEVEDPRVARVGGQGADVAAGRTHGNPRLRRGRSAEARAARAKANQEGSGQIGTFPRVYCKARLALSAGRRSESFTKSCRDWGNEAPGNELLAVVAIAGEERGLPVEPVGEEGGARERRPTRRDTGTLVERRIAPFLHVLGDEAEVEPRGEVVDELHPLDLGGEEPAVAPRRRGHVQPRPRRQELEGRWDEGRSTTLAWRLPPRPTRTFTMSMSWPTSPLRPTWVSQREGSTRRLKGTKVRSRSWSPVRTRAATHAEHALEVALAHELEAAPVAAVDELVRPVRLVEAEGVGAQLGQESLGGKKVRRAWPSERSR